MGQKVVIGIACFLVLLSVSAFAMPALGRAQASIRYFVAGPTPSQDFIGHARVHASLASFDLA